MVLVIEIVCIGGERYGCEGEGGMKNLVLNVLKIWDILLEILDR